MTRQGHWIQDDLTFPTFFQRSTVGLNEIAEVSMKDDERVIIKADVQGIFSNKGCFLSCQSGTEALWVPGKNVELGEFS